MFSCAFSISPCWKNSLATSSATTFWISLILCKGGISQCDSCRYDNVLPWLGYCGNITAGHQHGPQQRPVLVVCPIVGLVVDQIKEGFPFAEVNGEIGCENGLLEDIHHTAIFVGRQIAQYLISLFIEIVGRLVLTIVLAFPCKLPDCWVSLVTDQSGGVPMCSSSRAGPVVSWSWFGTNCWCLGGRGRGIDRPQLGLVSPARPELGTGLYSD